MNEAPAALGSRNRIEARLHTIKHPDNENAEVRFEVFSNGHTFAGEHHLSAQVGNKVVPADPLKDDFSAGSWRSRGESCPATSTSSRSGGL